MKRGLGIVAVAFVAAGASCSTGDRDTAGDTTQRVRAALEAQYARAVTAYHDDDPEVVVALRAPDFTVLLPSGQRWTAEESAAYVRAGFAQVDTTLHVSFAIEALTVQRDTAIATIHQRWRRLQQKAGRQRLVETEAVQREWWRPTPDGWRLFFIDAIQPGIWKVDGKRVDPSQPYDPDAPPFTPSGRGS